MDKSLNKSVLNKIIEIIPENIKPVNYFMDTLDLGKESAYRRLRGEKPLSFEEIYKLSLDLNFSLDEILENKKNNTFSFNYISSSWEIPENNVLEFLLHYEKFLNLVIDADKSEITITINYLLATMFTGFEGLFKFSYYRLIHQLKEVPLNFPFSNLIIPNEIKNICARINHLQRNLKKITFIVDKNLYLNLIKEIQYFYVRGLIDESELNKLKKQYLSYMDHSEKVVTKGIDPNGTVFEIYLSVLSINSTTSYAAWDDNEESTFWHAPNAPVYTRNKRIINRHKHWINSLKKYSTVITQSNELLQADYFNEQRNHVNNINDKILL